MFRPNIRDLVLPKGVQLCQLHRMIKMHQVGVVVANPTLPSNISPSQSDVKETCRTKMC